jgi:hypothetical protein
MTSRDKRAIPPCAIVYATPEFIWRILSEKRGGHNV